MLSEEEVRNLLKQTRINKSSVLYKGDDVRHEMHCKIEKVIQKILGERPMRIEKKVGRPRK